MTEAEEWELARQALPEDYENTGLKFPNGEPVMILDVKRLKKRLENEKQRGFSIKWNNG